MTTNSNNLNKGENKGGNMDKIIAKRNGKSDTITNVWKTWRAHIDTLLAEAGLELVQHSAPQFYDLKDTASNIVLGSHIVLQDRDRTLIETNLISRALADAKNRALADTPKSEEVDVESIEERRFHRHMMRELKRLEFSLAYLEGRLYDVLKDSPKQVGTMFGLMHGETKSSAFYTVTEAYTTDQGVEGERILFESHNPNDVLAYFGLEVD